MHGPMNVKKKSHYISPCLQCLFLAHGDDILEFIRSYRDLRETTGGVCVTCFKAKHFPLECMPHLELLIYIE